MTDKPPAIAAPTQRDLEKAADIVDALNVKFSDQHRFLMCIAAALAAAREEASGPGTPRWRLERLGEWVEREFEHPPFVAYGFEETLFEAVAKLKASFERGRLAGIEEERGTRAALIHEMLAALIHHGHHNLCGLLVGNDVRCEFCRTLAARKP